MIELLSRASIATVSRGYRLREDHRRGRDKGLTSEKEGFYIRLGKVFIKT